jgi:4-hydroxy 2-oxovalerate aldolase
MIRLMDCTLRDGGNVIGKGFDERITRLMLDGLIANNIRTIEMGNALGLGAPAKAPLTDDEYLAIAREYASKGNIGMFMGHQNANPENIAKAKEAGLSFLRVGANASDAAIAVKAVRMVKEAGLECRYSQMKAYVLSAEALADEALFLQENGVDGITIMDSAGAMKPEEVRQYVRLMKEKVSIPVAFHGHNNIGLATANALAAWEAGADEIDSCLLGMARSVGNIQTEMIVGLLQEKGELMEVDFTGLLNYLDGRLVPTMSEYGYRCPIEPLDLVCGLGGCHSSFIPRFKAIAAEENVDLLQLILKVSAQDRKAPSEELIHAIAQTMK